MGDFVPVIGGSAGIAALLSYFIMHFPYQTIYLFIFPVPAWAFGIGYFGYSYMNSDSLGGVGHAAHMGGFLTGIGYYLLKRGF
jgi:membrane associated rhomboid family serine protease